MLNSLPGELQDRIIRLLPTEDHQTLRLVSQNGISNAATRWVFEFLVLSREPKQVERVNKILALSHLRQYIRTVEVHIMDMLIADEAVEAWLQQPFTTMVRHIAGCDKLLNVHLLSLSPRPQRVPDPARSYHFLFELIANIFAEQTEHRPWIRYYIFDTSLSALDTLTPQLFPTILKITPQLSRLHLWVVHAVSDPPPGLHPLPVTVQTGDHARLQPSSSTPTRITPPAPAPPPPIFTTLREIYLLPSMLNLTELRISSADPYGYLPKFDLRGIHCPHLRFLSFRNLTFTHQWQFDWIYQHARSLEHVALVMSPIIRRVKICGPVDDDGYPIDSPSTTAIQAANMNVKSISSQASDLDQEHHFTFETRWYQVFDHIRLHFPRLVDFNFDQRYGEGSSLYSGVYATFDKSEEKMWDRRPVEGVHDWVRDQRHLEMLELEIDSYIESLLY